MTLELISFKLCPFMQPSVITLLHKEVEHTITYIDINDPPPWFEELSPTGQVPLLKVDDSAVIFESTIINEYLDDITPGTMLPEDSLDWAINRSWTQFCGSFFGDIFNLLGAKDEESVEDIEYDIQEKLDRVEAVKTDSRFFNGNELNLIDTSYAALFMRLDLLRPARAILDSTRYPKLNQWSDALLEMSCVKDSVVPDFQNMYLGMVKMREGLLGKNLE